MRNLTRKLFLSICTLAICAVTLVSTTFAWYTTNTSVEANNISGASADVGAASIFISTNEGQNWYQKVSGAATGTQKITFTDTKLSPVALDNGEWVDQKGEKTSGSFIEFKLWFKTNPTKADVKIGISGVTVQNTTGEIVPVDNLIDGSTYSVDILDSLALQIESETEADLKNTGYSIAPGGIVTEKEAVEVSPITDPNYKSAHDYCNAIVPGSVTYTTPASQLSNSIVIATLPMDGEDVLVTFRIYLDGANTMCFDSCKDQTFNVSLTFNVIE